MKARALRERQSLSGIELAIKQTLRARGSGSLLIIWILVRPSDHLNPIAYIERVNDEEGMYEGDILD